MSKVVAHVDAYAKKPCLAVSGNTLLVAVQPKSNRGIFAVDGNFSRGEYKVAIAEAQKAKLALDRLYVYAHTATYSGEGIFFTKFEELCG